MAQITITLDLTPETLDALHALVNALPAKRERIPYTNQYVDEKTTGESVPTEKTDTPAKGKDKPASAPAKNKQKAAPAADDSTKANPPAGSTPETPPTGETPTKTDVRALALKLSKAGKQDVIKKIFGKYGADKLSGVAEEHYPELMEDLVTANAKV